MRHAARADDNQAEIVKALREAGHVVYNIKWPVDLLVRPRAGTRWLPMEVKSGRTWSYTEDQRQFMLLAGDCPVATVTDVQSALRAVNAIMALDVDENKF